MQDQDTSAIAVVAVDLYLMFLLQLPQVSFL